MKKYLFLFGLATIFLVIFTIVQYFSLYDGKLHVIFCSVGQGDAILLKTPKEQFILVDSGPDGSVLNCLGRHMPFWQREIKLAILTHPHADHFTGFVDVLEDYQIDAFVIEPVENTTPMYKTLLSLLSQKHIPKQLVTAGNGIEAHDFSLLFIGPTKEKLMEVSPNGKIGQVSEQGVLETVVQYGNFRALLTADSQVEELTEAEGFLNGPVTLLQVPHHGSTTGLNQHLLEVFAPRLAVVSVGKNTYGHPSVTTLHLLQQHRVPLLRTDQEGDVEIVSDGKRWKVK